MNSSKRHARLIELFHAASDLPEAEVCDFLTRECAGDEALRAEVEAMLAADRHNASFLERPVLPRKRVSNLDSSERIALGPDSDQPSQLDPAHLPKIEGYRITGMLGHGGMGIVYRAVQTTLNRPVALKVLPAMIGSTSPTAVTRFKREATAAARLHHTNIVAIHDFGQSHDTYFYAMELIEGRPLSVLIKKFAEERIAAVGSARLATLIQQCMRSDEPSGTNTLLAVDSSDVTPGTSHTRGRPYFHQVAHWIADAADALHYAHGQGIVHRDIKPANVILATDRRIMITDFGLAKSSDEASVTVTGSLIGTIRYLSPEQAMAKRVPVDHRTDIYSLGATMYELLCFQPAFPGSEDKQVLAAIIARDPVRPRKILSVIPTELETICLKTLEKLPDKRYATARELADDLRRYLQNLPIVAKRPGIAERLVKYTRRHRAITVGLVAALLLTAAGGALIEQKKRTNEMAAERNRAEIKKKEEEALRKNERFDRLMTDALSHADAKQWRLAETEYQEALALDPTSVRALINLAILKKDAYNSTSFTNPLLLEEGLALLDRASAIEPRRLGVWRTRGVLYKMQGRFDDAAQAYEEATRLKPDDPYTWVDFAVVNALRKELDQAEANLKEAILLQTAREKSTEPGNEAAKVFCDPWRDLAAIQLLRGNLTEAETSAETAVKCQGTPRSPSFHLMRASVYLVVSGPDNFRKALLDANTAKDLAGTDEPLAWRVFALANLGTGSFDEAIQAANQALKLDDLSCPNHLIIAVAESRRGNKDAAKSAFNRAMQSWPTKLCDPNNCAPDAYYATAPKGILWFETARELLELRDKAAEPPSP